MKMTRIEKVSSKMGGATLTKIARNHSLQHLRDTLKASGRVYALDKVSAKDIRRYVEIQRQNVSLRTLQNRLSHIRTALEQIGRGQLARSEHLQNRTLGLSGANRDGTHCALTEAQYSHVMERAVALNHPGFVAALALQHELGLRAREAIQCADSLPSWEKSLQRGDRVHIVHGTKGGRARNTTANHQERALTAVRQAMAAVRASPHGRLIPSTSLAGAARAYQRLCSSIGLSGAYASHALRCTYAQERYRQNLELTHGDRDEARALTSLDLGHGDGRGTYVAQVYLKNPSH